MKERKMAFALVVTSTVLLAACAAGPGNSVPDMQPIGSGLEFLGISLVLATLVAVFGRFIGRK